MLGVDLSNKKTSFDPEALLQDFNTLFMLNLESTNQLTIEDPMGDGKEHPTNLEKYSNQIEFGNDAYMAIRDESLDTLTKKMLKVAQEMRNNFMGFHLEINKFLTNYASQLGHSEETIKYCSTSMSGSEELTKILNKQWIFETIPGKNYPDRWPEGLNELIDRLSKIGFLGLFHEDHRLYDDILSKLVSFVNTNAQSLAKGSSSSIHVESVQKGMTALILFALNFGDFSFWLKSLESLDQITDCQLEKAVDEQICQFVTENILPTLATLNFKVKAAQRLHLMHDSAPEEFFRVCHYDLKDASQSALTCDEEYLYLWIASRTGGLYKIGTGNKLTKAGKVYIYKPINLMSDAIKLVVIGDTIYRSYQGCEFGIVKTHNKHTLESTEDIQLNCPLVRADPANLKINKFTTLMTDGKHLYTIFKTLQLDPIDESAPAVMKEPVPASNPLSTPQPNSASILFKSGIKAAEVLKEAPKPSGKIPAELASYASDPFGQAPRLPRKPSNPAPPSRANLGPNAPLIPPLPPMPPGSAYFESDNIAPEDAAMIMQVLAENQAEIERNVRPEEALGLAVAAEGSIRSVPKQPSEGGSSAPKPPAPQPPKPAEPEPKPPAEKKQEEPKAEEKKSEAPAPAPVPKKEGEANQEQKPAQENQDDKKPAQEKEAEKKPEDVKPQEKKIEENKLEEKKPVEVKPEQKVEVKKPEEPKPAEKFIEIEEVLRDLVEFYFTQEREAEILERWNIFQEKQRARGVQVDSKPEDANNNPGSKNDPNIKINKEESNHPSESAKRGGPRTKPKEKVVSKPPPEPAERDRTGVMNFWLYRFDLTNSLDDISEEKYKDNPGVLELQESFAGLFTIKECANAFKLSQEDVTLAAQWLIDEGEKQRNKKLVNYDQITLISQGEIDPKCLKSKNPGKPAPEEITLIHSLITDKHIQDECIFHNGAILIGRNLYFSADPKDEYEIPDDIVPQISQDKKFVTPDRNRNVFRMLLKSRDGADDFKFEIEGLSPTANIEEAFRKYRTNMMNISEELRQYSSMPPGGLSGGFFGNAILHVEELGLPLPPGLAPRMERDRDRERELDEAAAIEAAQKQLAASQKSASAPLAAKLDSKHFAKKLRGTFICRVATALEKQEMFNTRCYDSERCVAYSISLGRKNSCLQNPGLIVKTRDPVGYQNCFKSSLIEENEEMPRGKIFFDGLKEVSYGHAENDIGIIEDQKKYFEKFSTTLAGIKSTFELTQLLNRLLIFINSKRFSLPFKFSDAVEAIYKNIKELDNEIRRMENPEEKKLLQAKKLKLTVKLEKLERLDPNYEANKKKEKPTKETKAVKCTKPTAPTKPSKEKDIANFMEREIDEKVITSPAKITENKKQYSYCPIGSEAEADQILSRLKAAFDSKNDHKITFYTSLLQFWSNHLSGELPQAKAKSIIQFILGKIEDATIERRIVTKLETVLIRLIYLVLDDYDLIASILKEALKIKGPATESFDEIRNRSRLLDVHNLNTATTTLLDKLYIIFCRNKHLDVYHPYNQAEIGIKTDGGIRSRLPEVRFKLRRDFGLSCRVKEGSEVNSASLFSFLLSLQDNISENPPNLELLIKWRIYYLHFYNVWILLEASPKHEAHYRTIREFVSMTLSHVERTVEIIEKDGLKNLEVFGLVLEYVLCMINIITCYTIKPKASSKVMIDSDFFASKNLRVMDRLMKIFKKIDAVSQGKISANLKLGVEGLDTNQQTIFETCHPLNRGENVKANTLSHPEAMGIVVQLDKRCQSDPNRDFMTMFSWDNDQVPIGNRVDNISSSSVQKVNIGIAFRTSGKMSNEEIFMLLGNHAKLQFEANPKSTERIETLKRWGYRARTIPIYGYESSIYIAGDSSGQVPPKVRVFGCTLVQILNRLAISLVKEIEPFLKGKRISQEEKKAQSYLNWTLMKSGLNSLRRELFLQDFKQGLKLAPKMKDTLSKAIVISDDKSRASKSVEETERLSAGSKGGDLDKDFLQDTQLIELLNRLQNNDDFLMSLINSVKGLQDTPYLLKAERMRRNFTKDLQKRWENTENLVLLALLHHSGVLKLLINSAGKTQAANFFSLGSVKEQLSQICAKKNEILNKMISEVQTEREFSQTCESVIEYLKGLVDKIKAERVKKDEAEVTPNIKDPEPLDPAKKSSKETIISKMDELKEKYSKKKVGKKSDHIKKDKEKEKDKKKGKPDANEAAKNDKAKPAEEMADKETPKEVPKLPEPTPAENFFEGLMNKPDVQEAILNIFKETQLSESNHMESVLISRGLPYIFDDPEQNKREVIKLVKSVVQKYETDPNALENPYIRVSNKIDERCFFLLKLATSFSAQPGNKANDNMDDDKSAKMEAEDEDEEDIPVPLDITRSLSSTGPGRKNSQKQDQGLEGLEKRADLLGEWMNHYKKWKKASEAGETSVQSESCSFLFSVGSFLGLREPVDTKRLEKVLLRVAQRACFRALGLDMIKDFLQFSHDTWLSKYLLGVFSSPFNGDLFDSIENLNVEVKDLIVGIAKQNLIFLMKKFISEHKKLRDFTPESIHKIISSIDGLTNEALRLEGQLETFFKQASMLLVEIYSLSSSSDFTSSHQWPGNDESVVRVFFKAMMEFSLFACSLGRVSSTCPTIQSIKKYLELTKDQAMIIFDKLCVKKSNTEFVLEELYWLLQKELGFDIKDEKMYFRIAMTVSDASRSDRICFLLDHCRVALLKSSGDLPIVVTRLLKLVFETLYLCSAPGVIKSCSGVIEAINTNKLVAKTSTNSYLNSFRTICHQKLYLQNTGTTKGISIIPPQTSVDVIDMKPINGFLNDSIEPSLMAMIVAKMGQMMEPGSEIEESISVKDMWKIPYMSMNNKPASAASPAMSTYRVILHQANEINFVNLLKVMYHLDQKFDLLNHQALETWAKYKEKAKQKGLKPKKPPVPDLSSGPEGVPYETYHYKLFETTIEGIPASSISTPAEEAELPIGWYLGALRKFQDLEGPKKEKKYIDKRKVNKTWNLNHISSISDRVRDALDKLPEPKEDATEEAKAKFVAEYNALSRYSDLCIYVHSVGQMLNKFGFSVIPIKGSLEQVEKIVIALEAAFQGKIKPISYDNFSTEVKNILNHKDAKETQTDSKPESMAISIINVGIYYHLKDNFEKVYPLNYGNNKINEGLNHNSFLTIAMPTGATTSHYISKVSEVLRKLILNPKSTEGAILSQIVNKSIQAMKDANISAMPDMDRYLVMGSLSLVSGWEGSLITGSDVKLKNSENVRDLAVIKVPQNSGKLASVLINNSDENVSTQFVNYSQIQKKPEEKNSIVATLDIQSLLDSYLKIESQIEEMQKSPNVNIASKEFNPVKWSGLVSLQLSSCLMLQMLFRHPNIKECLANKVPEVLLAKAKKSLGTPSNRLIFRTFIAWEGLVDKFSKLSTLISNPKPPQPLNIAPELDDLVMKDKIVPKDLKNLKPAASKEPSSYRLPASSYIECLPRSNPKSSNYKMVKYWEKHIIPKIENFVRSSFKQFEMDEFFEQLRIELRVLDHTKACVIAFKLCDGGLPNGCVPPDADYDWETIDIEDIEVGSLVCTKLEYRNSVISEKVKHLVDLGLEEVVSEVLIVDHQSKYVLVLIRDDNAMQSLTLWVPQQCIKPIEYPVHRQGHSMSYSEHFEELNKRISEFQTYLSQNILIKSLSLRDGLSDKIDSYQAIKWTVISELNNNLISGWLEFESQLQSEKSNENLISRLMRKEPTKLHKLECDLQVLCKNEVPIDYLINCINTEAKEIVKLLNDNFVCLNLKDKIETDQGQAKHISPLNLFTQIGAPENSVAAIAVTFDKKAYLGVTSGVKFYGDNKGLHLVNHILNNQKDLSLSNIPPILFQSNEIYYQFYSSVEGVPLWSRNLIVSDLPCVVHGIPYSWTPCCWLIDTLSTILAKQEDGRWTEKINQLLKTTINLSQEIKGPTIIKQMLYKLSTRLSRKIKLLARRKPELFADKIKGTEARIEKLYGLEPEITQMLHNELKTVLDIEKDSILPSDKFPLYSSYTQDLLELLATICSPFKIGSTELTPDPNIAIPEKLADLVNFSNLAEYFKAKEFLSTTNLKTINKGLDISGQTKNFVVLTALPPLKKNEILEIVYKTLQTRGARIVSKLLDVYLPVDSDDVSMGYAVLFIEGWNIPQSEEDTTIVEEKKEGEAPPPPPEPPANDDRMWVCPVCTLHNQMSAHTCETCDSPRPPDPEIVGDLPPEVKAPEEGEAKVEEKVDPDTIRAKVWLSTLQSSLNKYIDERFAKETKEYEQKVAEIKQKEQKEKEDREKEQKEKEKQQKKKGGSSSQPESEVTSPDKPPEAPVFVAPTPLPQQPKKIDTTVVQMQQGKSVLESTECIEAILSRMVLDEFQQPLDKILESEYANRKAAIDSMFGVGDKDSFFSAVKDCEPIEIITNLQKLGLDFWLDKISQEEQANRPILEQIIKETISFVEKEICGESRFFSNFVSKDIRLIEQNPITKFRSSGFEDCIGYQAVPGFESKYPYLKTLSTSDLRIIWEKISQYNTLFIKLLPLINLSSQCNAKIGEEPVTLAGYISSLRYLCLSYVKSQAKTHIMEKTSLRGERTPSIKVERLTENSEDKNTEINSKEVSTSLWKQKNKFTFLRAFDQLKKIPVTLLRPEQEKGSGSFVAFKVDLEGENVQGLAGPYRQFFADISSELQPSITKNIARRTLGMFIPTPNAEHKFGEDRHKFTVNPSANSSYYLQLFETLGVLMGCALRTDSHFTLDLPNILWKRITGEDITMQDLELVDKHFVENLKYLENCTPATLEQMGIENFTTKLSDGSIVELMPNGEKTKVTFERIGEYRELCLKARLDECSKQVEAIKKGIFQIVPEPYFKIITCKDLETEICGTNQVDFKLLKKNTIYSGGLKEDSQLLKNFWQVLDDMKESDKLRFIKFCWGQERLPASDDDYKRTQTRFMIKPSMSSSTDHNSLLPKADTCFFNLELPHYTNKESMQEKILLAINFDCDSLNAEVAINELNENADNRGDDME